jgi:biopolymer transport protein ExbD
MSDDDAPMSEINMIPFIDIALTLLIIMMVTTAFIRNPGVSLKLPETTTREGAPETKKDLTLVIAADGNIYVDATPMSIPQLRTRLKQVAVKDKESRILLKGDRDVIYARMMEVMDEVRQAGLTRVVLPTDPKKMIPTADPVSPASTTTKPNTSKDNSPGIPPELLRP